MPTPSYAYGYIQNLQFITIRNDLKNLQFVTGPAKIGHTCTQNLALFLNFNFQYLLKYKGYGNKMFIPYSQINKKVNEFYRT